MAFFNQAINILTDSCQWRLELVLQYGVSSTFWKVTGRITLRQNHRALST